MTNKEKLIYISIAIGVTLIAFIFLNTNKDEIEKLYVLKWTIVSQKADLTQQDLVIRNKIDALTKQILEIDAKLKKAINPSTGNIEPTWAIEQINQALGLPESTGR